MSEYNLHAYHYGFHKVKHHEINKLLESVAMAGKAYHNTECWRDDEYSESAESKIQKAAESASSRMEELEAQNAELKAKAKRLHDELGTGGRIDVSFVLEHLKGIFKEQS